MKALAFTVSFIMAFLLFAVQPMASKMVLPVLGGTPAVWNTAMLTFQLLLLAGYAYAHVLGQYVAAARQWMLHGLLVLASFTLLPLSVILVSSDAMLQAPILPLAAAFVLQIGLPFFVLSATAPLLQRWVSRSSHPLAKTPYVLYSASNLGSMVGLIGYVLVMEPAFSLPQQSQLWSVVYVLGSLLLLVAGWRLSQSPAATKKAKATKKKPAAMIPGRATYALWVLLAFLPSALSLSVTSYIATDIASLPLLWIIPLSLYLLSYVDAFRTRPVLVPIAQRIAPLLGMVALLVYSFQVHRITEFFILQLVVFAVLAFALHGWLARFKPESMYLTQFYFAMSIGGALGGVLNALVAPLLFTGTIEFPISLAASSVTAFVLYSIHLSPARVDLATALRLARRVCLRMVAICAGLYLLFSLTEPNMAGLRHFNPSTLVMATCISGLILLGIYRRYAPAFYTFVTACCIMLVIVGRGYEGTNILFRARNFFGVERVFEQPKENMRYILHNTTVHGLQLIQTDRLEPVSYYYALRGVFDHVTAAHQSPVAVIGLGAGIVQCYALPGQRFDYYEINPLVVQLAEDKRYFRYLSDCPGEHRTLLGDGRIRMQEVADGSYGVIILDAFSSDAIPAHLLTKQALALYLNKLTAHGVLMIHTTNRHIELWPLLATQAEDAGVVAYGKQFLPKDYDPTNKAINETYWVAIARRDADLAPLLQREDGWKPLVTDPGARPWTDDYITMLPYFKMFRHND